MFLSVSVVQELNCFLKYLNLSKNGNKFHEWFSMTKLRLMMKLIAGALVIFAQPVQAAKQSTTFKLSLEASPAGLAANTPTANVTLTPTATPLKGIPTKEPRMETARPVETRTSTPVETRTAAPTAHPPANVNIQLPDVHVSAGAETHTNTKETIIERTIEVKEKEPAEPQNNNVLYLAVFGILALAIVAGLLMMRNKSEDSDKNPPK